MKPHPRIRKTIKWGGLAVCILLSGLWAASERWWVMRVTPHGSIELRRGFVGVVQMQDSTVGVRPRWFLAVNDAWIERMWWIRWHHETRSTGFVLPLWIPLTLAAASTATAWRLDTLARCRASTHACAKCGYDRAGIAAEAKCPECGSAPIVA